MTFTGWIIVRKSLELRRYVKMIAPVAIWVLSRILLGQI